MRDMKSSTALRRCAGRFGKGSYAESGEHIAPTKSNVYDDFWKICCHLRATLVGSMATVQGLCRILEDSGTCHPNGSE